MKTKVWMELPALNVARHSHGNAKKLIKHTHVSCLYNSVLNHEQCGQS